MEPIVMQYYVILAIPSIVTVTLIIITILLFPFKEKQTSDLEHFANVNM